MCKFNQVVLASVLSLTTINAYSITIDGNLSDWGIQVADGTSSQPVGTNYSGLRTDLAGYHLEDTNDLSNNYYLGPNYGGQNYDGEFFGALLEGSTLYLSILSGQRPDNGSNSNGGLFSPGDIRIETSLGVFGIEVGGGAVGNSGAAITEGANGSTYRVNSSGYTTGHSSLSTQTAGSVWLDADWILDPISPRQPVQMSINSGSIMVGTADYIFTRNSVTRQHSIIELALDMNMFGGATLYDLTWLPSCGNDELRISTQISSVPEPASVALLGLGLLGIGFMRRRS
ncbi:PEP-CTERM sorting domain-containing protein [Kaarinaea lacus]